jgi:hypothetical protein
MELQVLRQAWPLFLAASLIGDTANFGYMVIFSVVAIFISLMVFLKFSKQINL